MRHRLAVVVLLLAPAISPAQQFLAKTLEEWRTQLLTGNETARRDAAFALGKMGNEATPAVVDLKKCLRDKAHPKVQEAAAAALGEIAAQSIRVAQDKDLVAALREALKDSEEMVRRSAAQALGRLGPSTASAQADLAKALKDAKPSVRQNAAWALGQLGKTSVKHLGVALADSDRFVQRDAAQALANVAKDEPDAVRPMLVALARLCEVNDSEVRRAALSALVKIVNAKDKDLAEIINPALRDKDLEVRRTAALTLAMIGGQAGAAAIPILREALAHGDRTARHNAALGIRHLGPAAKDLVPDLVRDLQDADPRTRVFSALALGGLKKDAEPAVSWLVRMLANPREDQEVRIMAGQALSEIGPVPAAVQAVPALLFFLEDPDQDAKVREKVLWALRTHQENLRTMKRVPLTLTNVLREPKKQATKMLRYDCAYMLAFLQREKAPEESLDVLLDFLKDDTIEIFMMVDVEPGDSDPERARVGAYYKNRGKGDGRKLALDALKAIGKDGVQKRPRIIEQIRVLARTMDPEFDAVFRDHCKEYLKANGF